MMHIQKKTIERVLEILETVDTYPAHAAMYKVIKDLGGDSELFGRVLAEYQTISSISVNKPVSKAKEWLKALVSDLQ